jgi:hypothetical protein
MSLMYQPPTGPAPFLVFGLVRVKSGMTGEAVIWMDAANALPAAFTGTDVATVFRGIGERCGGWVHARLSAGFLCVCPRSRFCAIMALSLPLFARRAESFAPNYTELEVTAESLASFVVVAE